jgi:hypothetical protein
MTTPSTPAGWYPDPDGSGAQRYWDGFAWTEHRSPAAAAPAPAEPAPGAHRAPDPDPAPATSSYEGPSYEGPSYPAPSFETPSYAAPSGGSPDNRKLLIGFLSAVGALLVILVLILVYAFVIRDDNTTQISASGTSTSTSKTTSSKSSETETSETTTESPTAAADDEATEGDFTFSVSSTDVGDTVTSPINEYIEKTATGEFIVVYLNVGNSGSAPLTFLSTLQVLNTDAGTIAPDDEASFYLGGGVVTINPGEQVETAIAFDVPVGTTASSIIVHGEPGGAGSEIPVS